MNKQHTLNIGAQLRQVRLQRGYTIQDVCLSTNLRANQIRAIETGNYTDLPGVIYAVGFVKVYADILGLDPDAAANQFKLEYREFEDDAEDDRRKKLKKESEKLLDDDPFEDNRVPSILTLFISLIFLILCISVWSFFQPERTDIDVIVDHIEDAPVIEVASSKIEIPVTNTQESEGEDRNIPSPKPQIEAKPCNKMQPVERPLKLSEADELKKRVNSSRVVIRTEHSSWIQVSDAEGDPIFKKVLRPGDEYFVPNRMGLRLSTSNAGVLKIYVDGKKVLPIGHEGDILRAISLDPDELKKGRVLPKRRR